MDELIGLAIIVSIAIVAGAICGLVALVQLKISWDVLWLVSGGIALGLALDKTGLAKLVVHSIPFDQFSPYVVLFGAAFLCLLMCPLWLTLLQEGVYTLSLILCIEQL